MTRESKTLQQSRAFDLTAILQKQDGRRRFRIASCSGPNISLSAPSRRHYKSGAEL